MSNDSTGFDFWRGLPAPGTRPFLDLISFCDLNENPVKASLPWVAAEISENSGFCAMLNFILNRSGTHVYVCSDRRKFNQKYDLDISPKEHSILLSNADSRGAVLVPSSFGVFSALRRTAIRLELESGTSDREIARAYGASLRGIKQEKRRRGTSRRSASKMPDAPLAEN